MCGHGLSAGLDESFLENVAPTVRALRRLLENVVGNGGGGIGDEVEDLIEWNLGGARVALFARSDQALRLAQFAGANKNADLIFGLWGEEVRHGGNSSAEGPDFISAAVLFFL